MISGPKSIFLAVCASRGYTFDQVLPCVLRDDGTTITVDELHPAYPSKKKAKRFSAMGLGDIVAGALAAVGITKQRVSAALGRPCKCGERQEKLNAIGRTVGIGKGPSFPNSR